MMGWPERESLALNGLILYKSNMTIDTLADFFMPEDRKRGEDLFANDVVSITSASDTHARAYVKVAGAPCVSFAAEDIASSNFLADCTCSTAKKGKLCKHIWATLLNLEAIGSDFLACKSLIEKAAAKPESAASLAAKVRQAEYKQQRKDQNKARNKKIRDDKRQATLTATSTYSDEVEAALTYFSANGFELSHPLQVKDLNVARKILARVFHPDKGGTHEEILMLNENHEVIADYLDRI